MNDTLFFKHFRCSKKASVRECYFWYLLRENGTIVSEQYAIHLDTDDFDNIDNTIQEYGCNSSQTLQTLCEQTGQITPQPSPPQNGNTRRKRQAGLGGGGQGGGGPPGQALENLDVCTKLASGEPGGSGEPVQQASSRQKRQVGPSEVGDQFPSPPDGDGPPDDWTPGSGPPDGWAPPDDPPPVNEDFEKNAEFLKLFMSLTPEIRQNIGHRIGHRESTLLQKNISSFISGCTYKGGTCNDPIYWYPFSTAEFGNCYIFNYLDNRLDARRNRKSTLTGSLYGLSVEIFLDQDNYMLNKLSKRAGARIVIHDPANPPLPDEYGLDLRPNTASSISVQMVSSILTLGVEVY